MSAAFSEWLASRQLVLRQLSADLIPQYLRYRLRHLQPSGGDAAALKHFLEFLRSQDAIPAEKITARRETSAERCVRTYEQYLQEARGLSQATIINYIPFVRSFLEECFGSRAIIWSQLRARDVMSFVERQARCLHSKRSKLLTTALRSFLRYAQFSGKVKLDLGAAVPVVPHWTMTTVPRAIPVEKIRQLLNSIDRSTAVGRRDYAIVLVLARLGLRASEVVFLELDDIDWNAGQMRIRGKAGQRGDLPLPADVGNAIAAYLRNGRPQSASRRVFLRARAPIRGFRGASSVGSIIRHRLQRAGIDAPTHGAHQFRHGLACELLRRGASLGEIGELLGHQSPETTRIYAKVDLEALRTLALPWPGGVR
ncbi:MAG: tyrosine-type recombinase/integrase [Acidobacteriaceae bacterium]|nr:tyrosine-type recombinase/integrase [Acidobacteriaceae bacterium]